LVLRSARFAKFAPRIRTDTVVFETSQSWLSLPIPVRFNGAWHRVLMQIKPADDQGDREPGTAVVLFIEGGGVEHAIDRALPPNDVADSCFEQARKKPLSNMATEMVLRRMQFENVTVHGFRSSLRDWAGIVSSFPREIVETAVALLAIRPNKLTGAATLRKSAASCEPKTLAKLI
jgi:hypothetical protein